MDFDYARKRKSLIDRTLRDLDHHDHVSGRRRKVLECNTKMRVVRGDIDHHEQKAIMTDFESASKSAKESIMTKGRKKLHDLALKHGVSHHTDHAFSTVGLDDDYDRLRCNIT